MDKWIIGGTHGFGHCWGTIEEASISRWFKHLPLWIPVPSGGVFEYDFEVVSCTWSIWIHLDCDVWIFAGLMAMEFTFSSVCFSHLLRVLPSWRIPRDDSPWEGTRLDHDLSQLWVLVVEHCPDCRWLILYHWILLIMPMIAYKSDALSFCRVKKTVACQSYQSRPGLITSMPRVASKGHQHTPALCKDTVSYHPRRPGTGHGTKNESLGDIIPAIYIYIYIYIYYIYLFNSPCIWS